MTVYLIMKWHPSSKTQISPLLVEEGKENLVGYKWIVW